MVIALQIVRRKINWICLNRLRQAKPQMGRPGVPGYSIIVEIRYEIDEGFNSFISCVLNLRSRYHLFIELDDQVFDGICVILFVKEIAADFFSLIRSVQNVPLEGWQMFLNATGATRHNLI